MSSHELKWTKSKSPWRKILKSTGVQRELSKHAVAARDKANESGFKFHAGVDVGDDTHKRKTSARAWVGASSVNKRTGKPNAGLHEKQVEVLKGLGW